MSNVVDHPSSDELRKRIELLPKGSGGPYDGGMEQRVASLEKDMTDVKVALARIEAKLDSKIDYKWLTVYVLGLAAVILRAEIASLFTGG